MQRKLIMITGASSGLGRYVAGELARMGLQLILVCRNYEQENQLRSSIPGEGHIFCIADLSLMTSVTDCVQHLAKYGVKPDVLINNAGIFLTERKLTAEGNEMQFAVNYLAPFVLTNEMLRNGLLTTGSRIINISSISHYFGRIRFDDLTFRKNYDGLRAYEQSKLAIVLFTYELSRRLKSSGVTVNVLSPGRVNTAIGDKHATGIYRKLWLLNKPILRPVSKGAATYLYLTLDPGASQFTGKYFYRRRPVWSSPSSYNKSLAVKLWNKTKDLTSQYLNKKMIHEFS